MKPVIGLNCDLVVDADRPRLQLWHAYARAVELAGGVPVVLPATGEPAHIDERLDLADGLVLIGGGDYDPRLYGAPKHPKTKPLSAERQFYDLELARAAIRLKRPVLALCAGHQLVNIICGGDLIQHLPDALDGADTHDGEPGEIDDDVDIEPDSMLARIVETERLGVDSTHHQAVGRVGGGLRIAAASPDGIIEALESTKSGAFLLCVQWHPERLAEHHPQHLALFAALVAASLKEPGRA